MCVCGGYRAIKKNHVYLSLFILKLCSNISIHQALVTFYVDKLSLLLGADLGFTK